MLPARSPDTISDMAAEQSDLNPQRLRRVGYPTRVCTTTTGRGRVVRDCRGGMRLSGPGND